MYDLPLKFWLIAALGLVFFIWLIFDEIKSFVKLIKNDEIERQKDSNIKKN